MRRSEKEHSAENSHASRTWAKAPKDCHHLSGIVTCPSIKNNAQLVSDFSKVMETQWKTTGPNYAMIANSTREIGETFLQTRIFYRVFGGHIVQDSESTTDEYIFTGLEPISE